MSGDFDFVYENRRRWSEEAAESSQWCARLFPRGLDRFRNYLRSPYHVDQGLQLDLIFEQVYDCYREAAPRRLDVAVLLQSIFGRTAYARDGVKLKRRVQSLVEHLAKFSATEQLEANPIERERLICLALYRSEQQDLFQHRLGVYREQAENLPDGVGGSLHRWSAANWSYLNYSTSKDRDLQALSLRAERSMANLNGLVGAMYECERLDRSRILALASPPEDETEDESGADGPLIELHRTFAALKKANGQLQSRYLRFLVGFRSMAPRMDAEQLILFYLSTRNFLLYLKRSGRDLPTRYLGLWPIHLAESGSYRRFRSLPAAFALEEYRLALLNGPRDKLDGLLEELLNCLEADHRPWVADNARMARNLHDTESPSPVAPVFERGENDHVYGDWKHATNRHGDNIRSALERYLRVRSFDNYELARRAIKSAEKFIARLKKDRGRVHEETILYFRRFIRISRLIWTRMSPYAKKKKPVPAIRRKILDSHNQVYAAEWLLAMLDRAP